MKRLILILLAVLMGFSSQSQLLSGSPNFPTDATSGFIITVDAAKGNQGLAGYTPLTDVYVHTGVITNLSTSNSDWRYVKFGSTPNLFITPVAGLQASSLGAATNKWQYTITGDIRSFYGVPAGETILKIAILFRSGNGSKVQRNSDGSDMYIPVYTSAPAIRLTQPLREPRFVPVPETITKTVGENIDVTAVTSAAGDITLKLNGTIIQTANGATSLTGSTAIVQYGNQKINAEAVIGGVTVKDSIEFFVPSPSAVEALPANVQDGINYITNDSVVLVLYAPNKSRVSVIGEFNNWTETTPYQMKVTPDFKRFWVGIGKLTPGQQYAYQYLVNGTLRIGDPYSELILDKNNDQFIPSSTYPGLKAFPAGASGNFVSVLQTAQTTFNWTASNYVRPNKKDLIIYELHLRDFLSASNWQTLTDSLNYLKNLGINCIELMPFTEFEGNNSWGYNPTYIFAPDKAYGTKNALKTFIDEAHKKGMAVILDAVLNQTVGGISPLGLLYWDNVNNRPAADNPWLNPTATHPFNVFEDFNHESEATKYYTARFIRYWLSEYKLDGFRWDLSKGFTQKVTTNVGDWNAYDQSRINIWQRYYDTMQVVSPGSYCILEHLGNDDEEAELAKRGMLLWGKMTDQYNENTMGYNTGTANLDRSYWTNRPFWNDAFLNDKPHLVVFAESHDEERTMYKNIAFGNASGGYNVKDTLTALQREEAKAAVMMMTPGPKMLWQFEELGYDKSIFMCENGTIPAPYSTNQSCKVNPKPVGWNYNNFSSAAARKKLYNVFSALNKLRAQYKGVFNSKTVTTGTDFGSSFKKIILDSSSLKVVVVANFGVTQQTSSVNFPEAGTWYSYLTGETFVASAGLNNVTLQPGQYYVYLNKVVAGGIITSAREVILSNKDFRVAVYPNPVQQNAYIEYELPESGRVTLSLTSIAGQQVGVINRGFQLKGVQRYLLNRDSFAGTSLAPGNYIIQVKVNNKVRYEKITVQR